MHATPLFPLFFLILGHLLLPTLATPVRPDAPPMQINHHYKRIMNTNWGYKDAVVPAWKQTLSPTPSLDPSATPSGTVAPPSVTPTVPLNSTTLEEDSGSVVQPIPASKEGSSLSSVNAGVALASRETMFFMVLTGVIATSLIF